MNGPEHEEDKEQMMSVPESFKVGIPESVHRCNNNEHQRNKHDVPSPPWASGEIDL